MKPIQGEEKYMRVTFNTVDARLQKSKSNLKSEQRNNLMSANRGDSFISFCKQESKKDNSLKRNLKLMAMLAMFSAATNAQGHSKLMRVETPTTISVENKQWWDKFSPEEQKVIVRVENEVAKTYGQTGQKMSEEDISELIENLDIDEEQTPLVEKLLRGYDKNNYNDFYSLDSQHMSPRAQKIKQKALVEVLSYSSRTGKIVKYSDRNIKIIAKKVGANEEELAIVKCFLKSYLDVDQTNPQEGSNQKEIVGDLSE